MFCLANNKYGEKVFESEKRNSLFNIIINNLYFIL